MLDDYLLSALPFPPRPPSLFPLRPLLTFHSSNTVRLSLLYSLFVSSALLPSLSSLLSSPHVSSPSITSQIREGRPEHVSATSVVVIAVDHQQGSDGTELSESDMSTSTGSSSRPRM